MKAARSLGCGAIAVGVPVLPRRPTWICEERAESKTPATAVRATLSATGVKRAGGSPPRDTLKPMVAGCAAAFGYACAPARKSVQRSVDEEQTTMVVPGAYEVPATVDPVWSQSDA